MFSKEVMNLLSYRFIDFLTPGYNPISETQEQLRHGQEQTLQYHLRQIQHQLLINI